MTHDIGKAHGGRKLLAAAGARTSAQDPGLFTVDLGPVLWLKFAVDIPTGLKLGLLTKAPAPEDNGFEELRAEGYERQPLNLQAVSSRRYERNTVIIFGPFIGPRPKVTHAAVFDDDGALLYYGAVLPAGGGGAVPHWMEFGASKVSVKRLLA